MQNKEKKQYVPPKAVKTVLRQENILDGSSTPKPIPESEVIVRNLF